MFAQNAFLEMNTLKVRCVNKLEKRAPRQPPAHEHFLGRDTSR